MADVKKKNLVVGDFEFLVKDLVNSSHKNLTIVSHKKISWKCKKCDNVWQESVTCRKKYESCPKCEKRKTSNCLVEGCNRTATFNYKGRPWGTRCSDHAEGRVYTVGNNRCEKCDKQATFNKPGEAKAKFCKKHAEKDMKDKKNKTCEKCETRATFNSKGQTKGIFCSKHAEKGMIDVTMITCKECDKTPIYNIKGEKKGEYCKDHAKDGMVDVVNATCEKCDKRPTFNKKGEKRGKYCIKHALVGMVDVENRRCKGTNCTARPRYGFPGKDTTYCVKHKIKGMIYKPNKRCITQNCKEMATYGYGIQMHCKEHHEDGEIDLLEMECSKCKFPQILGKDGLCGFCNPAFGKVYEKLKEMRVKAFFDSKGLKYVNDQMIKGGALGRERPDFLIEKEDLEHYVIVEVDEEQHYRTKEKDIERMKNIAKYLEAPVAFIRFNPDKYKKEEKKRRVEGDLYNKRTETLWSLIQYSMENNPIERDSLLSVYYLYYDGWNGNCEESILIKSTLNKSL